MSWGTAGATHDLSGLPVGRGRLLAAMLVLLALLLVAAIGSAMSGAVRIPLDAMPALLGVASDSVSTSSAAGHPEYRLWEGVLLDIRLPRILLGMLAGAALAVAGAVMQALFRNPLAEPGLVGVSVGGAVGAVGAIVLGYDQQPLVLAGAAFVGSRIAPCPLQLAGMGAEHQHARRTTDAGGSLHLAVDLPDECIGLSLMAQQVSDMDDALAQCRQRRQSGQQLQPQPQLAQPLQRLRRAGFCGSQNQVWL